MNRKPDPEEFEVLIARSVSALLDEDGDLFIHLHDEDGNIFAVGVLSTDMGQLLCKQVSEAIKSFLAGPLSKCEGTA